MSLCDQSVDIEGHPDLFYVWLWLFYFMCVDMYSLQMSLCVFIMHMVHW